MKRDIERIREMLMQAEESNSCEFQMSIWGADTFDRYQLELMNEAGLIEMGIFKFGGEANSALTGELEKEVRFPSGEFFDDNGFRLTWEGHEYFEAVRDEGVWNETKKAVVATGGSATLEVAKSIALAFLKKKINQHTGLGI